MRFVASSEVPGVCTDLSGRKFLVVGASAGPLAATGLRRRIDDAVEGELAARGALPAAIGVDAELASCIRDQVFRARALGTTGLAIALPPLAEMSDPEGRLNVDDSAALLAWTRATAELPVVLLASEADRTVSAYAPMPLERLLASEGRAAPPAPPPVVDEATWIEASREPASDPFDMTPAPAAVMGPGRVVQEVRPQVHLTPPPPAVGPRSRPMTPRPPAVAPRAIDEAMAAPPAPPAPQEIAPPPPAPIAQVAPIAPIATESKAAGPDVLSYLANADEEGARPKLKPGIMKGMKRRAEMPAARVAEPEARMGSFTEARSVTEARAAALGAPRAPDANEMTLEAEAAPEAPRADAGETASILMRARDTSAARAVTAAEWRNLALELDAARGPKPVRVIEQLFMTRYVPLVGAVARGETDGTVRSIVDSWSQAFEQSYTDSFSAMRVTGKRPMMTFDAPEIAMRIARLNGARSVKLLLVDGMSYDLGERVSAEMRARATASGVCVDRLLLWSALPTVTTMQMQLIARGPDALRDVEPSSEPEPEIARGRAIATLRRERLGTREVMKLDLVEARLRTAGPPHEERLDSIADEVAAVLARYLESLPARTLLFVFGDHGFRLPRSADGRSTGPATQGGASPEEVLVPGYAWLTGGVH